MAQGTLALGPQKATMIDAPYQGALTVAEKLTPGGRLIGLTKGQFSMIDLIKALLTVTGPAHMTLSTWTAGVRDTENVGFLVERGDLLSLRLLIDRSFPTRQPKYVAGVLRVFGEDAIRVSNTHAKFCILRNERWAVCVRSSMNLNRNRRFENFDIDDNAEICDHFEALVDELGEKMPPGLTPPHAEVERVFARSLRDSETVDTVDDALSRLSGMEF